MLMKKYFTLLLAAVFSVVAKAQHTPTIHLKYDAGSEKVINIGSENGFQPEKFGDQGIIDFTHTDRVKGQVLSFDLLSADKNKVVLKNEGNVYKGEEGNHARTQMFWYKYDENFTTTAVLMQSGKAAQGEQWTIQFTGGAQGKVKLVLGGTLSVTSDDIRPMSGWHHFAISYGGGQSDAINMYVDGLPLQSTPSAIEDINTTLQTLSLVTQFKGNLDDVRFFNSELSAENIANIYQDTFTTYLQVQYLFNENQLPTDQSGNNFDAIKHKAQEPTYNVSDSRFGSVIQFNGTTQIIKSSGYKGEPGASPRTQMFWIRQDEKNYVSVSNYGTADGKWNIQKPGTNKIKLVTTANDYIQTKGTLDPLSWTHVAIVYEGLGAKLSEVKIYFNGELQELDTSNITDDVVNTQLSGTDAQFGLAANTSAYFHDARWYSGALTPEEIREIAATSTLSDNRMRMVENHKVYWNSNDKQYHLSLDNDQDATVHVYHIGGQCIRSQHHVKSNDALKVADLPKGNYIVKVLCEDNMSVHRISL